MLNASATLEKYKVTYTPNFLGQLLVSPEKSVWCCLDSGASVSIKALNSKKWYVFCFIAICYLFTAYLLLLSTLYLFMIYLLGTCHHIASQQLLQQHLDIVAYIVVHTR